MNIVRSTASWRVSSLARLGLLAATVAVTVRCGFPAPDTPLTRAAEVGAMPEVRELLSRGASPDGRDSHGLTPLVRAARRGHKEVVEALLAAGADPNLQDSPVTRAGWTPLMNAIHKNQMGIVRLLLAAGANVNFTTEDGNTALMLASGDCGGEMVEVLLEAGANPYPGHGGSGALTNAVVNGSTETVKALLAKAPDLSLERGLRGRVALAVARATGHSDILELLRRPHPGRGSATTTRSSLDRSRPCETGNGLTQDTSRHGSRRPS